MRLTSALESVMKVIGMEGSFYGSWFAPCASEAHSQWSPSHLGGG